LTAAGKAQFQIHFCVVLWGFTAILGKLISLPALPLVWWRMLLVTASLLCVPRVWRGLRALSVKLAFTYAGIGALVSLHWLTFYGAIKLSNASVGATCIALGTGFTALVEPRLAKRKFSLRDLGIGLFIMPGVLLVTGGVPSSMRGGIAMGTVSALILAVFASLNKRFVDKADALTVTVVELGAGVLTLSVLAPLTAWLVPALGGSLLLVPSAQDLLYLLLLAFVCTLLPFALSLVALRQMSAFSAQLAVNLEPVYAIVFAVFLLQEQRELSLQFYLGVAVILGAVLLHPLLARRQRIVP
jgi:drug/metabolite transporter (DMT)-like permease